MKNKMEDIDALIKSTLSKEEAGFYNSLEEQDVFGMLGGLFKGKNAWFLIVINILVVVFLVLFVFCCVRFFQVDAIVELMRWGVGAIMALISLCMLKVYAWMQMDKNAILREMKRLEIQVMSLYGKVSD